MSQPITDMAEVSIDFPEKFYMGSFGRGSRFDVTADAEGLHLHLDRQDGQKRHVGFHIHYYLLADILAAAADAVSGVDELEPHHRARLAEALGHWRCLASTGTCERAGTGEGTGTGGKTGEGGGV
ncbi:MAG: hypothetical protein R3D33_10410 [Hyphomicrobiaceae bacterium]